MNSKQPDNIIIGRKVSAIRAERQLEQYYIAESATIQYLGHPHVVMREPVEIGTFHLVRVEDAQNDGVKLFVMTESEQTGNLYQPIHPSMTPEDIQGAAYAYDDGTHWMFAHCSPDEQLDYASELKTYAIDQFAIAIAKAQLKIDQATNGPAKTLAISKLSALIDFADAVGDRVRSNVIGETLGYYHRNPHTDHGREMTVNAINHVLADWKKRGLEFTAYATARTHVSQTASEITTTLLSTHSIQWRHVRAEIVAAAKKAKEAAEQTETTPSGDSGS